MMGIMKNTAENTDKLTARKRRCRGHGMWIGIGNSLVLLSSRSPSSVTVSIRLPFGFSREGTINNSETDTGIQPEGQKSKEASHWLLSLLLFEMAILPLRLSE